VILFGLRIRTSNRDELLLRFYHTVGLLLEHIQKFAQGAQCLHGHPC
jgi:hypothetical protein